MEIDLSQREFDYLIGERTKRKIAVWQMVKNARANFPNLSKREIGKMVCQQDNECPLYYSERITDEFWKFNKI